MLTLINFIQTWWWQWLAQPSRWTYFSTSPCGQEFW